MRIAWVIHPTYHGLANDMLAWIEDQQRTAQAGVDLRLTAWAFSRDAFLRNVLRQRGYTQTNDGFLNLSRSIEQFSLTATSLPGYSIRSVQADQDIPHRVAIHRAAFGSSKMSEDGYRVLIHEAPTYRADLDLVIVAPDKSFAAFCLIWFDPVTASGIFEPVGYHPDHRQRGLT